MKKSMKRCFRFFSMTLAVLLLSAAAMAQSVVTGKITDSKDGSPVAGATVTVKGTQRSTQTAADGTYKLTVADGSTLVFTSVGFGRQEIAVNGATMNVSLVTSSQQLSDLVVVAYGTRKKSDLTSAITSISSKDFQKGAIASSEQLLQGKVAGLQITTGGGAAGGGSTIRIRGGSSISASNDPLIVIDGVPVDNNNLPGSANLLNTINPNDIESMSVLKDASATSLYGSRASNGVILITTKKGLKGKIKFNFNTQLSAGAVAKKVSVLTADQIRTIINTDAMTSGNNTYKSLLGSANTDWQDQIFQTAIGNDNNLSASGAIGNIPFRISGGYLNQDGILKTDHFNRYSTALNLSPKFLDDHLSINLNVKYSSTSNRFADQGAVGSAAAFDPTQPVHDATHNGKWGGYYEWLQPGTTLPIDLSTRNPLALLELRHNTSTANRIIGNVQLDYKLHFFPDLHLQANLGLDNANGSGHDNRDSIMATDYKTAGRYAYYKQGKQNKLAEVSLFYTKDIKSIKSKIDVLALHGYQDFLTNVSNYASYGQNGVVIANSVPTFATDKPEYRLESYLGRMNYAYDNKYYLTASVRRDASSKFSPATRVGYFPAVSAAWKLKEDFFKNTRLLSELKLRGSWGVTGQQDISGTGGSFNPLYPYLPVYSVSNSSAQYQFGNAFISYLRPGAYDPNIKWETTTTSNLGLDFGFLNNRISGSVEVYQKKTKDLLGAVPQAAGRNFDISIVTNIGNLESKGVEFVLNTTPVKTKNVTWDFGFNVAYNEDKITNLGPSKAIPQSGISGGTGNQIGIFDVGYAPFTFNVYQQVYDSKTSKLIEGLYEDRNRDGAVDAKDQYYYKKPAPDVLLGLSTQLMYNKWVLGLAAHGAFGNYLYNNFSSNSGVLRSIKNPINFIGNAGTNYLSTGFVNNQYLTDYYIENASYLRLDNINIGFNAGKVFGNKVSLRVNASVQNVFVITKYSGLDPENSDPHGVDNNIYPRPRIFSLGCNLDF
ncbi:SusC/RagA family TonB-linked outer membrane protein [Ferruginibacter paludis]|uniref:SusC/RagA family TonB-linked outer membrane protein n=1 Tax=Ferruginibacter paludis TaxID=1310417 RepID=UPI0025B4C4E6|nr:SusC/RagA family TonB-linked outer membrane protein [Ferruginibacter paludis]MDN3659259.1 SusC/RagA family TonB-linked outer membrane protein [Ferruginibacter paludis]